jgi:hypothetical protein
MLAHRLRLVPHAGCTFACAAACRRKPVDLDAQLIERLLNGGGGLRRLQRKGSNFRCDDGETLACLACPCRLDRGVQCEKIGLAGDDADFLGDLVDIGERL